MNRNILTIILLLAVGAGRSAVAQDTNSAPAPADVSLESLVKKNIFDPTRSGRARTIGRPRPKVVRTFTFRGTVDDDVAFFSGDGAPRKGYVKAGDAVNGFKVMKIPVSYDDPTVILTDPAGAIVVLKEGESMRREEDGPWTKSDQPAPAPGAATETKSDASTAPPSPGPAGESDILKRLRLKREQEEK